MRPEEEIPGRRPARISRRPGVRTREEEIEGGRATVVATRQRGAECVAVTVAHGSGA